MQQQFLSELDFCTHLWSTEWGCSFGGGTRCSECAAPYLLLKFISGDILHGDMHRLTLEDWQNKIKNLKEKFK